DRYYFNKDLKDLNLAEEAYLAGLPQVPNNYNIYDHPKAAEDRKNTVLYLMHYHKRITDKQWEDAKKIDLKANLVNRTCLLYTSDAADDTPCVDLGGRRIIKKFF
ncbi:transglycosylase domain-containing protein, partial [Staphylococcus aureus]